MRGSVIYSVKTERKQNAVRQVNYVVLSNMP
jgi:hypothetical protein